MQSYRFFKLVVIFFIIITSIIILYFVIGSDEESKPSKELGKIDLELPKIINGIKKTIFVPDGNFYMDETPVTYADFQKYVEAGGVKSKYWDYETYNQLENPVTGINWYHAIDYCNWRSIIEGLSPAYKPGNQSDAWGYPLWELDILADGYRLPSEAEFEYAARGGLAGKSFPWGDEFNPSFANYDDEKGEMKGDWWRLAKVKDSPPNNYGLYGMSGNVWHWTNDWHEFVKTKILKGGSWGSISPDDLRIKSKSYSAPSNYNYDIGFRCIRLAKETILENPKIDLGTEYQFYQYPVFLEDKPTDIDIYDKEFAVRLSQFITDHYINSIYFQIKIDRQEIMTPKEMTELIIEVSKEYQINPLFLTGIIAAESGFGTVSFPRWYNNPMAYHWQNALMKNGPPIYEANYYRNRKYKDLKSGFQEFAKGIRNDIYLKTAIKNLDAFHLLYVGYRANEWMFTISKVYNDILGIRLEQNFPEENVGKLIYTDW